MKSRILFVDDSRQVLDGMQRMLREKAGDWSITCCDDPCEAWDLVQAAPFDAVVLDIKMPRISGLELLRRMKAEASIRDVPVVMLTGLGDRDLKRKALHLGAADLLNKPAEAEDLLARIENVLRIKFYEDRLKEHNLRLEREVRERTAELFRSRLDVVWRLGKAAEHRDNETGNHVIRVGCMARAVAERLGMDRQFTETLFVASPLHDIGKVGIPDAILLKNGPLSPGERHVMMQHCWIGERILKENAQTEIIFDRIAGDPERTGAKRKNPLLEMAARIALTHHERWDGAGYPQGLAGDAIPVESRITAIVDVFDALTSRRPYKPPSSDETAVSMIADEAGTHFDEGVHRAFEQSLPELRAIRKQLCDCFNDPQEDLRDAPHLVRG